MFTVTSYLDRALKALRTGFQRLGYRADLVATDYTVCDWFSEKAVNRTVPIVAFGREPYGYDSACLTAVIANGLHGASLVNSVRSVGAPVSFEIGEKISVWQVGASLASTKRIETFELARLPAFLDERKHQLSPDALLRAKNIEASLKDKQLDFIDAGLIPALEHQVREKLDEILSEAATIGSSSFRERHGKDADVQELFALIFRLLAGKIMEDRKVPGFSIGQNTRPDVDTILNSVASFYHEIPVRYLDKVARKGVCDRIWGTMSLANVSVEVLSYIYENTLIAPLQRQKLGTHSTPYQVARHIVHAIPFENYSLSDLTVLEPCSGHAIFLVAALQRLRDLSDITDAKKRHAFFTRALKGFEKDAFAVEVSRLCLMMADFPNPDGWQVKCEDVFTSTDFIQMAKGANIVLANPPFEDFTPAEDQIYQGLTHRQKPIEILDLVLKNTPAEAAIGFVLPKAIINGSNYKAERAALFDRFEQMEVVSLPDKIFTHSEIETALVIGKTPRTQGSTVLNLAFKEVLPEHKAEFLDRGTISWNDDVTLTRDAAVRSLCIPKNRELWQNLSSQGTLEKEVDLHRGVEWKQPFDRAALISERPRTGWWQGYYRGINQTLQYVSPSLSYLNPAAENRRRKAWDLDWSKSRVFVNAVRASRGFWRMAAFVGAPGVVCTANYIALFPKSGSEWSPYALSAVLNSSLANAFICAHCSGKHNAMFCLDQLPLPNLTAKQILKLDESSRSLSLVAQKTDADPIALEAAADDVEKQVLAGYKLEPSGSDYLEQMRKSFPRPISARTAATAKCPDLGAGGQQPLVRSALQVVQELIDLGVVLPHVENVVAHLERRPDITRVLLPVGRGLFDKYGHDSEISLVLHHSREEEDDTTLDFKVRKVEYPKNFFSQLMSDTNRFNRFFDELDKDSWLGVTTDLERPYACV
jgi:type I restriction-modification system DNA methylase subunit